MFLFKVEVRETKNRGMGVFLCEDVPAGTTLWIARLGDTCKIITAKDLANSPDRKRVGTHGLLQPNGDWFLSLDEGQYTNHSATPTSVDIFDKDGRLHHCKAARDLTAGTELTTDYTKSCVACADGVSFEVKKERP